LWIFEDEIEPFYAHFGPEAPKWDFLGSKTLFLATGAARDRPPTGLGFGRAARGAVGGAGPGRFCAWGSPVCEDIRVLHRVPIDADITMLTRGGLWRGTLLGHLQCGRAAQFHLGPPFELPEVRVHCALCKRHLRRTCECRTGTPGTGITNAEYKLAMYALATDRPGCLECQVHGTCRTCRTGQVSHGRMVWPS
jgi:hypothetical protein